MGLPAPLAFVRELAAAGNLLTEFLRAFERSLDNRRLMPALDRHRLSELFAGNFWQLSPAASVIERKVIAWLGSLFGYPETATALGLGLVAGWDRLRFVWLPRRTVNTGAVDPIDDIAHLCVRDGLWLLAHIKRSSSLAISLARISCCLRC